MALMDIGTARGAAADWVEREGRRYAGYRGAYVSGSTVALPPGSALPVGTDVDIMLVTDKPVEELKLGKFEHRGVLLEVTHLSWDQIRPAFAELLADLGISSTSDLLARAEETLDALPAVWRTTEELILANPGITRD